MYSRLCTVFLSLLFCVFFVVVVVVGVVVGQGQVGTTHSAQETRSFSKHPFQGLLKLIVVSCGILGYSRVVVVKQAMPVSGL